MIWISLRHCLRVTSHHECRADSFGFAASGGVPGPDMPTKVLKRPAGMVCSKRPAVKDSPGRCVSRGSMELPRLDAGDGSATVDSSGHHISRGSMEVHPLHVSDGSAVVDHSGRRVSVGSMEVHPHHASDGSVLAPWAAPVPASDRPVVPNIYHAGQSTTLKHVAAVWWQDDTVCILTLQGQVFPLFYDHARLGTPGWWHDGPSTRAPYSLHGMHIEMRLWAGPALWAPRNTVGEVMKLTHLW